MAIRTLSFNVSVSDSPTQNQPVWAGMQFEDNATEVVFCPDAELVNAVGDSALFRIDFNSPAGYSPSSNLTADQNGNYRRSIPYSMTFIGGELEAVFVVTSADGNLELLSFPITLYLTEVKRDAVCADELHKGLSMVEESVRQLSLIAEESADKAEESADKAQKSAEAAEAALAQTEEGVQRFEEAAEAKADLQFKEIEGGFSWFFSFLENTQICLLYAIETESSLLRFSGSNTDVNIITTVDLSEFKIGKKYLITVDEDYNIRSIEEVVDLSDKVSVSDIDHSYNPESENAQSGKAVAEALATVGEKEWQMLEDISLTEAVYSIAFDAGKMNSMKEVHIEGYIVPTDTTITSQQVMFNDGAPVWQTNVNCKATGKFYIIMDIYKSPRSATVYDGTVSCYDYTVGGSSFKITKMSADLQEINNGLLLNSNQLVFRTTSANPMAAGTRIKVWGR